MNHASDFLSNAEAFGFLCALCALKRFNTEDTEAP